MVHKNSSILDFTDIMLDCLLCGTEETGDSLLAGAGKRGEPSPERYLLCPHGSKCSLFRFAHVGHKYLSRYHNILLLVQLIHTLAVALLNHKSPNN